MRQSKVLNNERGFIKFLLIVGLLGFLVYMGIQFGMPYYKYSAFKSDIKEMVRVSVGDIRKTKTEVLERAKELKIPVGEEEVDVQKKGNVIAVTTSWTETVDLLGVYQKTLDFEINIEG